MYPSSIQKQNVNLVLKIFSEKNIAALKHVAKDNPELFEGGTCEFINIIMNFWKIVNVRSVFEGKRFNDDYREAVRKKFFPSNAIFDKYVSVVKEMASKYSDQVCIICPNFSSYYKHYRCIFTVDSIHIFENYSADDLLLSKFQNDNLEGCFGMYRQLSGSNFYISFIQVLENERKIRFKNSILLCSENTDVELKTLMTSDEDNCSKDCEYIDAFLEIIDVEFNFESVPHNFLLVLTYIGGFIARKVLLKCRCTICTSWLQIDKEVAVEETFDLKS